MQGEKNMAEALSLNEARMKIKSSASTSQKQFDQQYQPMFLPISVTKEAKKGAMEVTTRQTFLNTAIPIWQAYHVHRAYAIILAIAAVALFPVNIYLSTGAAALAGRYYGDHVWKTFYLEKMLKKRWILEGT